jgi:hypothetical protein
MCHLLSLLFLDEAIASMEQEEIRHNVMMDETTPVVRLTLVVPTIYGREDQECYNYKKMVSQLQVVDEELLI